MQGFLSMRARVSCVVAAVALGMTAAGPSLAADGPLLAPPDTCSQDDRPDVSPSRMETALACLVNHARRTAGVPALPRSARLGRSAQMKADLIVECDEFSHSPCGRPWSEVFRVADYRGWAREILAMGSGNLGTARGTMEMWLDSTRHRDALLDPQWTAFGVAARAPVTLEGSGGVSVLVAHFGRPPSRPSERQPGGALR